MSFAIATASGSGVLQLPFYSNNQVEFRCIRTVISWDCGTEVKDNVTTRCARVVSIMQVYEPRADRKNQMPIATTKVSFMIEESAIPGMKKLSTLETVKAYLKQVNAGDATIEIVEPEAKGFNDHIKVVSTESKAESKV